MSTIPFHKLHLNGRELASLARALLVEGRVSGGGLFTGLCQEWLRDRLGCARAFLTPSGTAALEMAALLAGIAPGDEVLMPSFSYVSTASAFVLRGARPVFLDIRPDTLNLDEALLEAALTPLTKAVVPVHYGGYPCALDDILGCARRHGLIVIEDAAQAVLSTYRGKFLGALGHLGCLSFHGTKNLVAGEGGALLVNDPAYLARAEIVWDKGTDRARQLRGDIEQYSWIDLGSSFAPSDLTAAFLYAQLQEAESVTSRRRRLCRLYFQGLRPLQDQGLVRLPPAAPDGEANGHLFYLLTGSADERARLRRHLAARRIHTALHYLPLHSSPAGRLYGRAVGDLPVTDTISRQLLRLPLYADLQPVEVERVVAAVTSFYQGR